MPTIISEEQKLKDEKHHDPSRRRTPDSHGVQPSTCKVCETDSTNYSRCPACGSRELIDLNYES